MLLPYTIFCCGGILGTSWPDSRYAVANAAKPAIAAHEIGHDLGLQHRSGDHGETNFEPVIDHGEIGGLGWDVDSSSKFIKGLLKVIAKDGVRSAEDTSNRGFQVPGKAPFVGIGAPLEGAVLTRDVPVRLHGLATAR